MRKPKSSTAILEERSVETDVQAITALSVEGFKSIHDKQSIAIAPLTVLAGANSSGKSSIMQPLLLLKQTVEASYDPGPLLLGGPNIRFTSRKQLFSTSSFKEPLDKLTFSFSIDGATTCSQTYVPAEPAGIDLVEMIVAEGSSSFTLRIGMTSEEIESVLPDWVAPGRMPYLVDEGRKLTPGRVPLQWSVARNGAFLNPMVKNDISSSAKLLPSLLRDIDFLQFDIRRVVHVPGLRGSPERAYERTTAIGPEFPGTFEHYVASVIAEWQTNKADSLDQLGADLQSLGLTWKVVADVVNDVAIELRVGRLPKTTRGGSHDLVSIADVGLGVSQVLPVLVALLVAEPGQLVYIDQPELHLHPRAQSALAAVLASAAKRGVRVVVETHSSLLLLGIQTLVAQGELSTDLVKFHWFSRDPKTGYSTVTSTDLDEAGAFDTDSYIEGVDLTARVRAVILMRR